MVPRLFETSTTGTNVLQTKRLKWSLHGRGEGSVDKSLLGGHQNTLSNSTWQRRAEGHLMSRKSID